MSKIHFMYERHDIMPQTYEWSMVQELDKEDKLGGYPDGETISSEIVSSVGLQERIAACKLLGFECENLNDE